MGVRLCLNSLIRDERDAILVPVPQYPLYSASIALYNGSFEGYVLDEDANWGMNMQVLQVRPRPCPHRVAACPACALVTLLPRSLAVSSIQLHVRPAVAQTSGWPLHPILDHQAAEEGLIHAHTKNARSLKI